MTDDSDRDGVQGRPDVQPRTSAGPAGEPRPSAGPAGEPRPWAAADRPRGLDASFAPGGEDEAPPERVADERRLTRLLVVMVVLLIAIPTILTIIAFVGQLLSMRGS
jgi:hypothetical protein